MQENSGAYSVPHPNVFAFFAAKQNQSSERNNLLRVAARLV
jgi:hypothetical protein